MIPTGILFLFFFRLITDFVEGIYAFGLLGVSIPVEIVAILLLFTPLILLASGRRFGRRAMLVAGWLALLAGAAAALLDTRGRLLAAGVGTGSFLVFLPALLAWQARQRDGKAAYRLGSALALGTGLAILYRAWNSGVQPSTELWAQASLWLLALIAAALLPAAIQKAAEPGIAGQSGEGPQRAFLPVAGMSVGAVAALALLYFAFASPNVMARWGEASYPALVALTAIGLAVFGLVTPRRLGRGLLWVWNAAFLACLVGAILPYQIHFPAGVEGYPLYEPQVGVLPQVATYLLALLAPVVVLDFGLACQGLARRGASTRQIGGGFSLGALFLLLLIFAQVFTTVYDYMPVVGPMLRDRFWLVFLLAGLGACLPALAWGKSAGGERQPKLAAVMAALAAGSIAGVVVTAGRPAAPAQPEATIKVLTYNIQQGYDKAGQRAYREQAALMRQLDPDIIGLQETDSNRIAGGNADLVRYFADQLDLFAYYGPKTVPGTFGVALLSRYPIEGGSTFYMYSEGEQTATIAARITVGGRSYPVFVTHLGNGGPMVQAQAFLQEAGGLADAITMGDFNFRPGTPQYQLVTGVLKDAWLLKWPTGIDDQGNDPARRIDHVFLAPGMGVADARYLSGPESDHPAYVVAIAR